MSSKLLPTIAILEAGGYLFPRALEGLAAEDLRKKCGPHSNPMIWIAGHLLHSRTGLANLIGMKKELPWPELFGRYTKPKERDAYPPISEIVSGWKELNALLMPRLESLSEEELSRPCPREFPVRDKSLQGAITFVAWHESYHLGQMAYLRKWLGYGGLVG